MNTSVIIMGGGVAGMSAAHELAERGFKVTVFEKKEHLPGGKARSVPVKNSATDGRKPLPGEHGFRFFPGFYKHITDTMKRIPYQDPVTGKSNLQGVFDNLIECPKMMLARMGQMPLIAYNHFPHSLKDLRNMLKDFHGSTGLTDEEKDLMVRKVWQLMTSCEDRRLNEYEHVGWWEFTDAQNQSENYRTLFVQGLTRTLVAARAKTASTKTGGAIFLQLLFNMITPGVQTDRILCGPTNDVWLFPWLKYLKDKGVDYQFDSKVEQIECEGDGVSGVWVSQDGKQNQKFTADFYLCAMPVERTAEVINKDILLRDPCLAGIKNLAKSVAWMNGIQFYLTKELDMVRGHIILADSPWSLTAISQLQFWKDFDITQYGDGTVKSIISVDVSDWNTPGVIKYTDEHGKPIYKAAKDCTQEEAFADIWEQIKQSFNVDGKTVLEDKDVKLIHLDGDIKFGDNSVSGDEEPLLVNRTYTWDLRPSAYTDLPDFFLAGDYIQTYTDLATMEGANEAARRAVNCIIEAAGSSAPKCEIWKLHEPDILLYYKWLDDKRYDKGLPWKMHEPEFARFMSWIFNVMKKILPKNML